jgi:hypothetical protein
MFGQVFGGCGPLVGSSWWTLVELWQCSSQGCLQKLLMLCDVVDSRIRVLLSLLPQCCFREVVAAAVHCCAVEVAEG